MDLVHVTVATIGKPPQVLEVFAFLHVIGLIGMDELEPDKAQFAVAEGLVGFFDRELDQLSPDVAVVARSLLGVGDDHVDGDLFGAWRRSVRFLRQLGFSVTASFGLRTEKNAARQLLTA